MHDRSSFTDLVSLKPISSVTCIKYYNESSMEKSGLAVYLLLNQLFHATIYKNNSFNPSHGFNAPLICAQS